MTFLLENRLLILVAPTFGALLAWPSLQRRGGRAAVSANEAVQCINARRRC